MGKDIFRQNHPYLQGVSGTASLVFEEISEDDPKNHVAINGKPQKVNRSITELRKAFGGEIGVLTDPATGKQFNVSLEPWKDKDPDKTFIYIEFRFRPD